MTAWSSESPPSDKRAAIRHKAQGSLRVHLSRQGGGKLGKATRGAEKQVHIVGPLASFIVNTRKIGKVALAK